MFSKNPYGWSICSNTCHAVTTSYEFGYAVANGDKSVRYKNFISGYDLFADFKAFWLTSTPVKFFVNF